MNIPNKQFMFHFCYPMHSINAKNITIGELSWCKRCLKDTRTSEKLKQDKQEIKKMFKLYFPELLI